MTARPPRPAPGRPGRSPARPAALVPLLLLASVRTASAHEPLFMMSHEAPGRGAFDVHAGLEGARGGGEDETGLDAELTVGLSRDLALEVRLPGPVLDQRLTDTGRSSVLGVEDPSVRAKWRFWDLDRIGRKYAAAAMIRSSVPLRGSGPLLALGLSQGMESLDWYYFVDLRTRFLPAAGGDRPGTRFHADAAGGWRPYLHGIDDTDIVLFIELNYEHRLPDLAGGRPVGGTGGDFVFVSPEILASPSNRLMFKTGFQLPLAQFPRGKQDSSPVRFAFETEIRF